MQKGSRKVDPLTLCTLTLRECRMPASSPSAAANFELASLRSACNSTKIRMIGLRKEIQRYNRAVEAIETKQQQLHS